jgi:DNA-binding SARP family transcriptional activator
VKESAALNALFSLLEGYNDSLAFRADLGLPAQIAGLAMVAALRDPEEGLPPAEELERRHPGRFHPELLGHYSRLEQQGADRDGSASVEVLAGLADPARLQRSLLSLAQTMEASGDLASAGSAYLKLLEGEPASAQATSARLGLARLYQRQGHSQAAASWALEAPRRAKPLGPAAFGQAALGCGLLLQELGHTQAEASLKSAASQLERVGLHGSAAIAWLALGSAERLAESLQTLSQPAHWGEVSRASHWLLPKLLEQWTEEGTWTAAERLLLAFSDVLARLQDRLTPSARNNLLALLEKHRGRASTALLEALSESSDPSVKARASALKDIEEGGMPFLRLRSMGFFEVYLGETKIEEARWRTQKTKYLLAYLAGQPRQAVLSERLVDNFWPESRAKAQQNLWAATSAIRRVLKPGNYVLREGDTLSLNPTAPYWHDYEELDKLLVALTRIQPESDPETFGVHCQRIAQLYTGPYLDGCYLDFAVRRRGQLEETVARILSEGAHLFLRQKRYPEALEMADRALDVDPLRADGHLMKMRAHLGLNQPEMTVSCFEACERMLRREFELEPTTAMLEILMRAKNGLPDPGD